MKAIIVLGALVTATAPAQAVERKLLVANFENIVVIGDIDVTVETGKSASATASGDKRTIDSLELERIGTTLRVRLKDIASDDRGVPATEPLKLMLTTRAVRDITLSGTGSLSVSEVRQPTSAKILLAGNGSVAIGQLVTDRFLATISGNGKIELGAGIIRDAEVTIDGAGTFEGAKVAIRKLGLKQNGSAVSTATVTEQTEIYNRGSGSIAIGGSGTCFVKLAGNAAIACTKVDSNGRR